MSAPNKSGMYNAPCDETDYERHIVRVFWREDELWVNDPDIGHRLLKEYCDNLTNLTWEPA